MQLRVQLIVDWGVGNLKMSYQRVKLCDNGRYEYRNMSTVPLSDWGKSCVPSSVYVLESGEIAWSPNMWFNRYFGKLDEARFLEHLKLLFGDITKSSDSQALVEMRRRIAQRIYALEGQCTQASLQRLLERIFKVSGQR